MKVNEIFITHVTVMGITAVVKVTVYMGLREEAILWQAENNSHKIKRHIYSNTSSGVSQHTEVFLKFLNNEPVTLAAEKYMPTTKK
jgi:hypothetical protein